MGQSISFDRGDPVEVKRVGRVGIRVGVVLLALGILLGGAAVARVMVASTSTINGPRFDAPGEGTMTLDVGDYVIFERTGSQSGAGPVHFSQRNAPSIRSGNVSVTGPSGEVVVTSLGGTSQTVNDGADIYTGVAQFDATTSGIYSVSVTGTREARVLVGRSITGLLGDLLPWLAAIGVAALLSLVGMVLLIVGVVRRYRARRAALPPPPFASQPPYTGQPAFSDQPTHLGWPPPSLPGPVSGAAPPAPRPPAPPKPPDGTRPDAE